MVHVPLLCFGFASYGLFGLCFALLLLNWVLLFGILVCLLVLIFELAILCGFVYVGFWILFCLITDWILMLCMWLIVLALAFVGVLDLNLILVECTFALYLLDLIVCCFSLGVWFTELTCLIMIYDCFAFRLLTLCVLLVYFACFIVFSLLDLLWFCIWLLFVCVVLW